MPDPLLGRVVVPLSHSHALYLDDILLHCPAGVAIMVSDQKGKDTDPASAILVAEFVTIYGPEFLILLPSAQLGSLPTLISP